MTKKEHLLEMLRKETNLSSGAVLDLFEIINKYDWDVFCSYMGDYDHPGERVEAEKVLDEKLRHYCKAEWVKVWYLLKEKGEIRNFYDDNFHTINDEYKE